MQPPAPAPSEPVKNLCVPWTSSGENGTPTSSERGTLVHLPLSRACGGEGRRTPQRANPVVRAAYLAEGHGEGALWRRSVPGGAVLLSAVQLDQGAALRVAGEFAVWRERTKGALVVREMPWGAACGSQREGRSGGKQRRVGVGRERRENVTAPQAPRARGGEEVLNSLQTASTSAAACGPATVSTASLQTELQPGDFGDFLLGHQPSGWRSFY